MRVFALGSIARSRPTSFVDAGAASWWNRARATGLQDRAVCRFGKLAGSCSRRPDTKADRVAEKGVLVLKNTERMDAFRCFVAMDSLLADYTVVLEPSWSGYANLKILSFGSYHEHPIVVMSPCAADHRFLKRLGFNLRRFHRCERLGRPARLPSPRGT